MPLSRAFTAWKRYRGGQATPIWIASLSDSAIEKIPRETSNDYSPMWVGDKVPIPERPQRTYPVTLHASKNARTKQVTQAVRHTGMDFKSASAGPGAIVIEQFGQLQLVDLASNRLTPVNVTIAGDISELRSNMSIVASPTPIFRQPAHGHSSKPAAKS